MSPAPADPVDPPRSTGLRLSQCELCHGWCHSLLCEDCEQRFASPALRCQGCGLRIGVELARCTNCLLAPPPFGQCLAAVDYDFPWDRLIAAFKFRHRVDLGAPLARILARTVGPLLATGLDWVLPVPLDEQRLAERGYNQAWEITRRVARTLGLPSAADVLQRPLAGPHQAELSLAQRQRNLRGAFMVAPARRSALQGRHVALVDDVMTSGATLREAARALQRAGVARVDAWVVARTPAPHG